MPAITVASNESAKRPVQPSTLPQGLAPLLDWLLSHVGHPLVNRAMGTFSEVAELNRVQWDSQGAIESRILKRVRFITGYAYENFRFYRQKIDSAGIHPKGIKTLEDFRRLPTVTKQELSRYLEDERILRRGSGALTLTGGTSGRPLAFLTDQYASAAALASKVFFDGWIGIGPHEKKFSVGRAWRGATFKDRFLLNQLGASYASILKNPVMVYRRISNFKPRLISGAVTLRVLAFFMAENGLKAGDWLKAVSPWGFPLLPEHVDVMSKAFCNNIYDRYGSSELSGVAAQQCHVKAGLHINTELCLIEVVKNGEPCADGERGRLVVTNLRNLATPFIRYEQGDTATGLADCACGRNLPLIARIEGKDPTQIEMKGGVKIPIVMLYSLVRRLKESKYIERISLRNTTSDTLIVTVFPGQGFDLRSADKIQQKLADVLAPLTNITLEVSSPQASA